MHIPVVFENNDFIIINKPIGLSMHSQHEQLGVVEHCKREFKYSNLYLTHRLDSPTSGCLLLAKNKQTASQIGHAFENRQVEKLYLALSDRKPKKKQGQIKGDMQKSRDGGYKLLKTSENPALTRFKSFSLETNIRLFICKPVSGKTHQIRVALKALSAPILGDSRYKGSASDRLYLHSYLLKFELNGQSFSLSCLPEYGALFDNQRLNGLFESKQRPENITW